MGYSAKVGSFNIDPAVTVGNTQAITGVGFQPKIVFFWWSGSTSAGDEVAAGTYNLGFGAAISSTSRGCNVVIGEDAQATSDCGIYQQMTDCIRGYTASDALDGIADFSSMDVDGFTLTIDNQFTQEYRISYLALGGTDLTNVYLGYAVMHNAVAQYSVNGVGFQPDALITFGHYDGWYFGGGKTNEYSHIGMATGSSAQGVVSVNVLDSMADSYTRGYGYSGEVINIDRSQERDSFVSFDADGFTLSHLEGTSGTRYYLFACLKGGQYKVHNFVTNTDSTDIVESDVGFTPVAVLFASANRALSTQDKVTNDMRISIGAGTSSSNRECQAVSDENGLATTETAYASYSSNVYSYVKDDALYGAFDIKSIDASGFTLDGDDGAASWVTYLAIGATAAAGRTTKNTASNALGVQSGMNWRAPR